MLTNFRFFGECSTFVVAPGTRAARFSAARWLPRSGQDVSVPTIAASQVLVKRMLDLIEVGYADVVNLRTLGAMLERQPAHLGSTFRKELGMTARECLTRVRLMHATELIRSGVKIEAVALTVGYRSKKNFYRQFKRHFATTPEGYRLQSRAVDTPLRPGRNGSADLLSAVNLSACDQALRHAVEVQQQMLRHFANSRLAMFLTNDANRYVGANQSAMSITGYSAVELRKLTPRDLFFSAPAEATACVWQVALPAIAWPRNAVLRREAGDPLGVHVLTLKNLLWGHPELSAVIALA
jgi:methylphosphotriester-DNA--protein-cysteine methyltransferase